MAEQIAETPKRGCGGDTEAGRAVVGKVAGAGACGKEQEGVVRDCFGFEKKKSKRKRKR